jgi:phage major head subunit gpT-like protein
MIGGNVPKHLVSGARTGFLTAVGDMEMPWQRVAMTHNMDEKSHDLVDLGAAPMPVEDKGGSIKQDFIEKSMEVTSTPWEITTWLSRYALDDDQTGSLERKVKAAGENFQRHINNRVFTVLNGGDSATYGTCYDGQHFFDNDHADEGAAYDTDQDNEYTLALSLDNFETVYVAAQAFVDDQGEYVNYPYDLLVCNPSNERTAANIVGNEWSYDSANRERNPYDGKFDYITSPQLDTSAWYVIASGMSIKPLIVVMRMQPKMLASWYDPNQPDGGRYYFKFGARYRVYYGDWRLAIQGQT